MHDACVTGALIESWQGYFRTLARSYAGDGGNSRYDEDDLIQECCIALLGLVDEVDPSHPEFEFLLKGLVKRRLRDAYRRELRKCRDVRRQVDLDEAADCLDSIPDPADEVCAMDLTARIEGRLGSSQQTTVWKHLIYPDGRVGEAFSAYRETKPEAQYVPISVFAEVSGLSERQCRYAMGQIRDASTRVLREEGIPCSF